MSCHSTLLVCAPYCSTIVLNCTWYSSTVVPICTRYCSSVFPLSTWYACSTVVPGIAVLLYLIVPDIAVLLYLIAPGVGILLHLLVPDIAVLLYLSVPGIAVLYLSIPGILVPFYLPVPGIAELLHLYLPLITVLFYLCPWYYSAVHSTCLYLILFCFFLYLLTIAIVFYLPVHGVMSLFYLHCLTTLPVCVHVHSSLTRLFLHCYHPQRQVSTFFFTSCGFFLPSITTHRCCGFSAFTQLWLAANHSLGGASCCVVCVKLDSFAFGRMQFPFQSFHKTATSNIAAFPGWEILRLNLSPVQLP